MAQSAASPSVSLGSTAYDSFSASSFWQGKTLSVWQHSLTLLGFCVVVAVLFIVVYAIPILHPLIELDGDMYADGGFLWNVPFEYAEEWGATDI